MFHLLQHELFAHQTAEEQSKEKGERKKRFAFSFLLSLFRSLHKHKVGRLFLVFVDDEFAAFALNLQRSCRRILDTHHITLYRSADRRIFKEKICIAAEGAVLKHKSINVA